jgi:hypothetical protein
VDEGLHLNAEISNTSIPLRPPLSGNSLRVATSQSRKSRWAARFSFLVEATMQADVNNPGKKPVVFLFQGTHSDRRRPELFRLIEPHLSNKQVRHVLGRANYLAQQANIDTRFIYRHQKPDAASRAWQELRPCETIIAPEQVDVLKQMQPDRMFDEFTSEGKLVHLLKDSS